MGDGSRLPRNQAGLKVVLWVLGTGADFRSGSVSSRPRVGGPCSRESKGDAATPDPFSVPFFSVSGFMIMALIAIVFAALGTVIGSGLKDMQGFQLTMNFLVMPIFFLSGALYPLSDLPAALTVLTHLDPLSYGVDGLRGAFISRSHFGAVLDLAVLGGLAALFLMLG